MSNRNKENNRRWYEERKRSHLCKSCGMQTQGKHCCKVCLEKQATTKKNARLTKKQNGVCLRCSDPALKDKSYCELHLIKNREANKKHRERRQASNLCQYCGSSEIIVSAGRTTYCRGCYLKHLSQRHLKSPDRWKELLVLFDKQPICPYTGIVLELGVNASLDHILPRSLGGTNAIENIQFVYSDGAFDVNRMKNYMTDTEFRDAIKLMYRNLAG